MKDKEKNKKKLLTFVVKQNPDGKKKLVRIGPKAVFTLPLKEDVEKGKTK